MSNQIGINSLCDALPDPELLKICQSYNPGQDLDMARAVRQATLEWQRQNTPAVAFDPEVLAERLRDVASSSYETAMGFGVSRFVFDRCAEEASKALQGILHLTMPNAPRLAKLLADKFTSGNSIPVERISISRAEYEAALLGYPDKDA